MNTRGITMLRHVRPAARRGLFYAFALLLGLVAMGTQAAQAQACPNWQLSGQTASVDANSLWSPQSFSVTAGGDVNLSTCPGLPGHGWVITSPDFEISYNALNMGRDLEIRAAGSCDTVLLVNDASGQWQFSDDADGSFNPRLRLSNAPSGTYDIWVGTFGQGNCSATLVMETFGGGAVPQPQPIPQPIPQPQPPVAAACPNWQLSGQTASVDANSLWSPQSFNVTAGGNVNLSNCPAIGGHGWVVTAPDFEIAYNNLNMGRDLEIRATGSCDTVLLVNDANGTWHFSDDADGSFNPRLRLSNAASGSYDIWVGTFGQGNCAATMVMETFGGFTQQPQPIPQPIPQPQPPVFAACPNWQQSGQAASVDANSLWSPQSFSVTAGGNVDLSNCPETGGHGWVITSPDFTVAYDNLNMGRDLEIRATGTCDTVLLVNDATGTWHFNDDADGSFNPRLRLSNAPSGSYDIWVGTFGQSNCAATMVMETFGGFTQQPQPPVIQPQPPVFTGMLPPPFSRVVFADPGNLTGWRGNVGAQASFAVTGSVNGSVWGTDIYTDDSALAVAAVHAGLVLPGQTGIVTVVIRPGQNAYSGSPRNGVQSANFPAWGGSFSFVFP